MELVATTEHQNVWHSVDITINADPMDTDGSESLGMTIEGLPSGVIIAQNGEDDITTDGSILSVNVSAGVETTLTATYQGSLGNLTFNATATESSTGDTTATSMVQVVDSHIAGLEYVTDSGVSGVTNESGFMSFSKGEGVSLFVGEVRLGHVDNVQDTLFLHDIAGTEASAVDNDYVLKLAVFLQSIDSDSDASNGITIAPETLLLFDGQSVDLETASMDEVQALLLSNGFEPIPIEQAQSHVVDTLLEAGILSMEEAWTTYTIDLESIVADHRSNRHF